ncbi:MAG: cellulose 1,4-beta-cellobiosidase [Frankiaceae bacterium]|nr:cellulose 1,4-beta-cellobiosidase [Frankiaceae bacterium]
MTLRNPWSSRNMWSMRRSPGGLVTTALVACLCPAVAAATPRPDLTIPSVNAASTLVAPGAKLGLRDTTRNAGSVAAGASKVGYVLSADRKSGPGDIALGSHSVKRLRARRSAKGTMTLTVPAITPAGDYFVLACADVGKQVRESNERNNCRAAGPVSVKAAAPEVTQPAPEQTAPNPDPGPAPGGDTTPPPQDTPPAPTAPAAPTGLTATPGSTGNVDLAWNVSSTATSYRVLRGTSSGGPYTQIATPSGPSYGDTGHPDSQRYFYVVQAVNDVGASPNSNQATALTCVDSGTDNTASSPTNLGTLTPGSAQIRNGTICRGDQDWYQVTVPETDTTATGKRMQLNMTFTTGPQSPDKLLIALWEAPASNTVNAPLYNNYFMNGSGPAPMYYAWGEIENGADNGVSDTKTFLIRISGDSDVASDSYSLNLSRSNS